MKGPGRLSHSLKWDWLATSYEVRVYRYENGSYKKIGTYVADAEGNIITELLTKGLRATSGTISVPLKNLGRDDAYRIEIQVMNGLDVIDTYMVEKSSDPVSNETMAPGYPEGFLSEWSVAL